MSDKKTLMKSALIICSVCNNTYKFRKSLYKHQRQKHGMCIKARVVQCDKCNREFPGKLKLLHHIRTEHNKREVKVKLNRLKCPVDECEDSFRKYVHLRKLLKQVHSQTIEEEIHKFFNIFEFEKWKAKLEEDQSSVYVKDTGEKRLIDGTIRAYYNCFRSYMPRRVKVMRRAPRNQIGSNKMGPACPSMMIVSKSKQEVNVIYYSTHVGHNFDGPIKLPRDKKCKLADEAPPAAHRDLSINHSNRSHEYDALGIKIWAEEMKSLYYNPILFYKEQNGKAENASLHRRDFVLIIMTAYQCDQLKEYGNGIICIHSLDDYKFKLFTITVVNDDGISIPVAFCFSTRSDINLLLLYFKCVKEKVGLIETSVFMSDDRSAFYKAWKRIMAPVQTQLLNSWDVTDSWTSYLNQIPSKEKIDFVSETLKVLHKDLMDEEDFHITLNNFLCELQNDTDTKDFAEYFMMNHSNTCEKWGHCFRQHLTVNTIYLESMHKTIKHHYLEGKRCRQLDKSVDALLALVRDQLFEKIIEVSEDEIADKIYKIEQSHIDSLNITEDLLAYSQENEWFVHLESGSNQKFIVSRDELNCIKDCALACSACHVCVHVFKCTCSDNLINFNMCKHIHACIQLADVTPESNLLKEGHEYVNVSVLRRENCEDINLTRQQIHPKLEILMEVNNKTELDKACAETVTGLLHIKSKNVITEDSVDTQSTVIENDDLDCDQENNTKILFINTGFDHVYTKS